MQGRDVHAQLRQSPVTLCCIYVQAGGSSTAEWWQRPAEAWQPGERLLACGGAAVADLRAAVAVQLGYSCSAGGRQWPHPCQLAGHAADRDLLLARRCRL